MSKSTSEVLTIIFVVLASTFLIWLPHLLKVPNFWGLSFNEGFNTIYRNYDGLNYIVIAKSLYNPELISQIPQTLNPNYYPAHFPGYPLLIALFAPMLGFLKSMLFVTLLFTIFAAVAFYYLVKDFKLTEKPLLLTLVFLLLPARWIIVRNVGSPEPVFIFFVILTLYFLLKALHNNLTHYFIWASAFFAALAQLTRPPGALLALSIGLFVLWRSFQKKSFTFAFNFYPFILVPLTLLGIFYWYSQSTGDFWAYFHSGDNIHLTFPPFQVFNSNQFWVGDNWLEDIIFILIIQLLAGIYLIKQKLYPFAFFVITFFTAAIFVAHRDISRYTLPIAPFVIIAFEKVLTSREFKFVLIVLALALYLYSQNFILNNTAPIPNLEVYN